jgi:hypothetical protein
VRGDDWCQRCQLWSIRSDSCRFSLVVRLVEMLLKTILVFYISILYQMHKIRDWVWYWQNNICKYWGLISRCAWLLLFMH